MIRTGLIITVASWVPLFAVGLLVPDSNPVGFGLLAWAGSVLGLIVAAIGVIVSAVRLFRG